jgi:hypothetical protein
MPPRGVKSAKRKRQYEHVKESELERGVGEDRAEEIAARTVNKQRAQSGETKAARGGRKASAGKRASGGNKAARARKAAGARKAGARKAARKSGAARGRKAAAKKR